MSHDFTCVYLLPKVDWSKLHITPHFILWGRITDDHKTLAHLCITERDSKLAPNNAVWEVKLIPYAGGLDVGGHNQAKHIAEKFERLWPCQFLAKEYSRTTDRH
jgi:hypothetical protein